jgi:hypothetical protein
MLAMSDDIKLMAASRIRFIEGVEIAFLNQESADFVECVVWPFSYVFATLRDRRTRLLKHSGIPRTTD